MAAPPPLPPPLSGGRLQTMLQTAVQSVQWTYSLFWQLCPQQGVLVWADGYYNGAIKTRKTVQPMEVSTEEASLQRSQQLRELYDSLSIGETNQPPRRPCAALSPEDLTESEWFYLMCVSFSFPPGVGLPGKAYTRRQHVWLTGVNEVDSKVFSRAILAKSASIQTVVCIPLLHGVVEFGTVDKVEEELGFVQHVKTFFIDHHRPVPKPALSEQSTSNPAASSEKLPHFQYSPPVTATPAEDAAAPAECANRDDQDNEADDDEDDVDEEEEDEAEAAAESDSEAEMAQKAPAAVGAEPSELMQLEMSEDIRLGSPDDGSNNLDSDFHMLAVSQARSACEIQRQADGSYRAESAHRWPMGNPHDPTGLPLPSGPSLVDPMEDLSGQEDTHYSETVSTILQNQTNLWSESSSAGHVSYSIQSAFANWTSLSHNHHNHHVSPSDPATSQWLLKYILFTVPFLHTKHRGGGGDDDDDHSPPKSRAASDAAEAAASRFRRGGAAQDELSANHVLAERRRREKLNERFIILRSLVPFVTKMDKASILGDTIEYVKQLRKKIQDLEARNRTSSAADGGSGGDEAAAQRTSSSGSMKEQGRSGLTSVGRDKRKMRIVEGSGGAVRPKAVADCSPETSVQVSIIESDGLLELQCPYREGLLLELMQMLRELRIEITTVQSSLNDGFFVAELRAKVKENLNGKKASIVEVKRAINQIIPHRDC